MTRWGQASCWRGGGRATIEECSRRGNKQKYLCVKCREGWVAISDIYYHNKKVMSPTDFYNGFLSKPGRHKLVRDTRS